MLIYVKEDGVLGIVAQEYPTGVAARWYIDGIEYNAFLEPDEYVVYERSVDVKEI